jgi:sugar lactone lactonase YvrE
MFVGDRSGTVFRIGSSSHVVPFVSLPPSLAAFHLAMGPDDALYVTGPTMATYDHVYRIDRQGIVSTVSAEFGRPQGLAVDETGTLYVVDALAGGAGLYRVRDGAPRELAVAASSLVGVAFDPRGGLVVASNDTLYRLDNGLRPWRA